MYNDLVKLGNTNSISHYIDRLICENIKLYDFQRRIEIELAKGEDRDPNLVSDLYQKTLVANEGRAYTKNLIDYTVSEAITSGRYEVLGEVRTFGTPNEVPKAEPTLDPDGYSPNTHNGPSDKLRVGVLKPK